MITYVDLFAAQRLAEPAPDTPSRARAAEKWPVLPPGTHVKANVYGARFAWLPVANDPGPAHVRARRVTLQAPRRNTITVRRDNLTVMQPGQPISQFDSIHQPEPLLAGSREAAAGHRAIAVDAGVDSAAAERKNVGEKVPK